MHKFYQLRDILNRKNLLIVYNSLVESILNYGIVVWGGLYKNALNIIQVAQNTLIKILFRKSFLFSSEKLYKESGLFNVRNIYIYHCLLWAFKMEDKYNQTPSYITRFTENKKIVVPKMNKSHSQRFVFYQGYKLFNCLPLQIKEIKRYKRFKTEAKNFLLNNRTLFETLF